MVTSIVSLITLLTVIVSFVFTYFRFFREGTHKQRIEFDIELINLGCVEDERILEIGVLAENKGFVEQKFRQISLKIYGLQLSSGLNELANYRPRLEFPIKLHNAKLVSEIDEYYFVRPKVKQRFPITLKIPSDISHVLVRAKFDYRDGDFHKAERSFKMKV